MIRFSKCTLIAAILAATTSSTWAEPRSVFEPPHQRVINVLIYNHAKVPPATLKLAKSRASTVLGVAGLAPVFLDGPLTADELSTNSACEQVPAGPTSLYLRILPKVMSARFGAEWNKFGFAQLSTANGFATDAWVFFHRANDLAETGVSSRAVILGHLVAHEIGHLLLGVGGHSAEGIMTAKWDRSTLLSADRGVLRFTPKQACRMQRNVERRWSQAAEIRLKPPRLGVNVYNHARASPGGKGGKCGLKFWADSRRKRLFLNTIEAVSLGSGRHFPGSSRTGHGHYARPLDAPSADDCFSLQSGRNEYRLACLPELGLADGPEGLDRRLPICPRDSGRVIRPQPSGSSLRGQPNPCLKQPVAPRGSY